MFSSRIVIAHCLLPFVIRALLPYGLIYVALLPNTVAEPVQISSGNTPNDLLATAINGAATSLSQEEIPLDFRVEFRPMAHGASFGRFGFLNTMIYDTATLAAAEWNSNVPARRFDSLYGVAVGFVSDRSGPGLRVKHVLWALDKIFDIVVNDDRYRSSNFAVHLGPTILGIGNVYSAGTHSAVVNISDKSVGDLADGSTEDSAIDPTWALSNDTVLGTDLAPTAYWQGNISPIQTPPLRQKLSTSMNLTAHGPVTFVLWYRPNGALVDDAQVYNASLKLLLKAAEPSNIRGTIWPGLTTYNSEDNFTFTLRPVNFASRNELAYLDSIIALGSIVGLMANSGGPPGKFLELDGIMQTGPEIIGQFCIDKGDKTGLNLQDLCNIGQPDGGNDEDGVTTAR